jgi:hypothetical protein
MSLILDALNKADREREYRDAVPDLNTVHGAVRPPRSRHPAWMIGGLIFAVLMVLVLLVLLWWRQNSTPVERATPQEPAIAPAQVAAQTPDMRPVTAAGSQETLAMVAAPPDEEVQALYQPRQDTQVMEVVEPQIQPALTEPTIITPEEPRPSTVDEALARALWEESRLEMEQPVPPALLRQNTAPADEAKPAAEPEPLPADLPEEETLAGHKDIPFLHELPVSVQNTIPTLMYAKHEYAKGFVIINKEELQVGGAAQGGVLLERILADGVLLSLDGTEFKLSSLSSWVNY